MTPHLTPLRVLASVITLIVCLIILAVAQRVIGPIQWQGVCGWSILTAGLMVVPAFINGDEK